MAEDPRLIQPHFHGTSRAYILDRLRRENRTDFVDAIEAGKISALTAAVELGWVKRPPTVATITNQARRRRLRLQAIADGALSPSQMQELWLGPSHEGSTFDSPEHLREAWVANQDEVMRLWAKNGRRPMAWWAFEAPGLGLKWPGHDREQSYLFEAGVLSEAECTELAAFWRKEFERTWAPGFMVNDGDNGILEGVRARRAHLAWAGIPAELIKVWMAERRRRGRTIRKLEAEVGEPEGGDQPPLSGPGGMLV